MGINIRTSFSSAFSLCLILGRMRFYQERSFTRAVAFQFRRGTYFRVVWNHTSFMIHVTCSNPQSLLYIHDEQHTNPQEPTKDLIVFSKVVKNNRPIIQSAFWQFIHFTYITVNEGKVSWRHNCVAAEDEARLFTIHSSVHSFIRKSWALPTLQPFDRCCRLPSFFHFFGFLDADHGWHRNIRLVTREIFVKLVLKVFTLLSDHNTIILLWLQGISSTSLKKQDLSGESRCLFHSVTQVYVPIITFRVIQSPCTHFEEI